MQEGNKQEGNKDINSKKRDKDPEKIVNQNLILLCFRFISIQFVIFFNSVVLSLSITPSLSILKNFSTKLQSKMTKYGAYYIRTYRERVLNSEKCQHFLMLNKKSEMAWREVNLCRKQHAHHATILNCSQKLTQQINNIDQTLINEKTSGHFKRNYSNEIPPNKQTNKQALQTL